MAILVIFVEDAHHSSLHFFELFFGNAPYDLAANVCSAAMGQSFADGLESHLFCHAFSPLFFQPFYKKQAAVFKSSSSRDLQPLQSKLLWLRRYAQTPAAIWAARRFFATAFPTPGIEETKDSCCSLRFRWVFLPWAWGAAPLACCSRLAIAAITDVVSSSLAVGTGDTPPDVVGRWPLFRADGSWGTCGPGAACQLLEIGSA
jgi:hypothetical protein